MNIIKKTKEHTTKLSMSGKIKKSYRIYCMVVVIATLIFGASVTAFAANDPIAVINNLSGFIFGLIRAVGLILLVMRFSISFAKVMITPPARVRNPFAR